MTTFGTVECVLKSENPLYLDVQLPNGIPVIIGRGHTTKIKIKRCSKRQVKLTANYENSTVEINQLGPNPSQVDNSKLRRNNTITVSEGTVINLLIGELPYIVTFKRQTSPTKFCAVNNSDENELKQQKIISKNYNYQKSPSPSNKKERLKRESEHNIEIINKQIKLDKQNTIDGEEEIQKLENIKTKLQSMQQNLTSDITTTEKQMAKPKQYFHSNHSNDKWENENDKLLIYTYECFEGKNKIAAFDLDHTIITTKSGRVFPLDTYDWKIMYPEIPSKLKQLNSEGYKVVIFTNQRNISKGKTDPSVFQEKVEHICRKLGTPLQIFVSTSPGIYRKPCSGMWDALVNRYNAGISVDLSTSFYIGDAAGRTENWYPKKKKDFSCSDRLFALNLQIQFYTPEEFFLDYKTAKFKMPVFDPRNFSDDSLAEITKSVNQVQCPVTLNENNIISSFPEIIVFVGFPAAGKSYFAENYLVPKGYMHINRDKLGSWQKCVRQCELTIEQKYNVVIDNTNPDIESRKRYIKIAQKRNIPCRCFIFPCSLEQAKHNNLFRLITSKDKAHINVNDMVLNSYKSKYEEPTLQEGFSDIIKVNFKPIFKSKEEERLYKMFLIDK